MMDPYPYYKRYMSVANKAASSARLEGFLLGIIIGVIVTVVMYGNGPTNFY
jgi:hypothetical protein